MSSQDEATAVSGEGVIQQVDADGGGSQAVGESEVVADSSEQQRTEAASPDSEKDITIKSASEIPSEVVTSSEDAELCTSNSGVVEEELKESREGEVSAGGEPKGEGVVQSTDEEQQPQQTNDKESPPPPDSGGSEGDQQQQPPDSRGSTADEQPPDSVEEGQPATEHPVVDTKEKPEEKEAEPQPEWEDLLGNGQLLKKVLRKGAGLSTRPTPQSRVKVRTRGVVEGGKVIDRHSSIMFTVGDGDVIQAWDLAVTLMERGETAQVKTNARFAYGEIGRSPEVPPNATITYELELLEVMEPIDYRQITEPDLLSLVDKKRVRGNELFQRKEFDRAVESYQKGLKMINNYIEEHDYSAADPPTIVQDMQIRCWNNMAAAQLKIEFYKEALESCENVLKIEPKNVKALFRSGKVLSLRGELDEAIVRLERAAELNPEEKAIQVELQRAVSKRKTSRQKEREMYRRMMEGGGGSKQERKQQPAKQSSPTDTWGPLPYMAIAAVVATIGIGLAYVFTQRH